MAIPPPAWPHGSVWYGTRRADEALAETKAHDHSGITVDDSSARPGRFAALTQLRATHRKSVF